MGFDTILKRFKSISTVNKILIFILLAVIVLAIVGIILYQTGVLARLPPPVGTWFSKESFNDKMQVGGGKLGAGMADTTNDRIHSSAHEHGRMCNLKENGVSVCDQGRIFADHMEQDGPHVEEVENPTESEAREQSNAIQAAQQKPNQAMVFEHLGYTAKTVYDMTKRRDNHGVMKRQVEKYIIDELSKNRNYN